MKFTALCIYILHLILAAAKRISPSETIPLPSDESDGKLKRARLKD